MRGILILPMLLTPIVVGLMWRALLDPNWGLLNWLFVQLGFGHVGWLSDPNVALWTLVVVDSWQWTPFVFVIVYARLQALPQEVFEAGSVDGANWFQRTLYLTLPLLMPAIVFAAVFRASTRSAPSISSTASRTAGPVSRPRRCPSRRSRTASSSSTTAMRRRSPT